MFWVIVVLVIVGIMMFGDLGSTTTSTTTSKRQSPDDDIKNIFWPEPKADNLWNSFEYFVRLGEILSKYQLDASVSFFIQYANTNIHGKGYFHIFMYDHEYCSIFKELPYLQRIANGHFSGQDSNSTLISLPESRLRQIIIKEAPHAEHIEFNRFPNESAFAINIKYTHH